MAMIAYSWPPSSLSCYDFRGVLMYQNWFRSVKPWIPYVGKRGARSGSEHLVIS